MKKRAVLIVSIVLASCIAGCSTSASNDAAKQKKTINIATAQPEGHPISVGLRAFEKYIEGELGNEVKIYYNAIMGDNSQALELLQMGTLDFVATSGSNLESFDDMYKIFGLPYLFEDEESFRRCMRDEQFISEIYNCTADNGILGVCWFANGVNNIYSTRPIYTPEDMKGLKFRVQASEANVKMAQGFGAAATVMAYGEVYTAMQNRVIDAAANPEMALVSAKHGEVAKYYSRTEHQIFADVMVANKEFMDSLDERQREIFEAGFKICTDVEVEEWDKQIGECIVEAEKKGVEFIDVDKAVFEEKQKAVREELLQSCPELQPMYLLVQEIQTQQKQGENGYDS